MGISNEPRKAVEVPVRVFGTDCDGKPFSENLTTVDVSLGGAKAGRSQAAFTRAGGRRAARLREQRSIAGSYFRTPGLPAAFYRNHCSIRMLSGGRGQKFRNISNDQALRPTASGRGLGSTPALSSRSTHDAPP